MGRAKGIVVGTALVEAQAAFLQFGRAEEVVDDFRFYARRAETVDVLGREMVDSIGFLEMAQDVFLGDPLLGELLDLRQFDLAPTFDLLKHGFVDALGLNAVEPDLTFGRGGAACREEGNGGDE